MTECRGEVRQNGTEDTASLLLTCMARNGREGEGEREARTEEEKNP